VEAATGACEAHPSGGFLSTKGGQFVAALNNG